MLLENLDSKFSLYIYFSHTLQCLIYNVYSINVKQNTFRQDFFCGTKVELGPWAWAVFYWSSHGPSPSCFSYFLNRVSHLCQASLDCDTPIHVFHIAVAGMTGACHHLKLFYCLRWNLAIALPKLAWNHSSQDFHLLRSEGYRSESLRPAQTSFC
jgi:hypothetical protein